MSPQLVKYMELIQIIVKLDYYFVWIVYIELLPIIFTA